MACTGSERISEGQEGSFRMVDSRKNAKPKSNSCGVETNKGHRKGPEWARAEELNPGVANSFVQRGGKGGYMGTDVKK